MSTGQAPARPLVSIVLPVLNEGAIIRRTLTSLLDQEARDFDLEILVIDAKSTDGSRQTVAEMAGGDPRIRLLTNERVKTPFAFNLGLREARGDFVCILGAHNVYERDYIGVCLRERAAHGAVGCTGRTVTRPADDTLQAHLVAWAMGHPFGSSGRSFRTQPEGYVDTAAYPVMVKQALLDVGGYDEGMVRNQDNDMNQRLRAAGHKLWCTWQTRCFYHPQRTVRALARYAFRNGYWVAISLRDNPRSMRPRHVIPSIFVLAVGGAAALAGARRIGGGPRVLDAALPAVVGPHACAGVAAALRVARDERAPGALALPFVFLALHASYGAGTLWGLASNARKPDPDADGAR